jgi:threonine/homoserine/homoserine lactone efflux protein
MFDSTTMITFLVASVAIIIAPGPAQALVLTRTLGEGRAAGAMTAVGLNVGTLAHAFAAALGLSAILATSAVAFGVVKYAGAAYLVYLGVRALRARGDEPERIGDVRAVAMFWRKVMTGALNPKVAVFFLAFLPQFVAPERGSAFWQSLILGAIVAALDVIYELILVWAAGALRGRVVRSRRFAQWRKGVTGAALIGLGARLALAQRQ